MTEKGLMRILAWSALAMVLLAWMSSPAAGPLLYVTDRVDSGDTSIDGRLLVIDPTSHH